MRILIFQCISILLSTGLHAQIQDAVDQMPYFRGCEALENGSEEKRECSNQLLMEYISDNLSYPDSALQAGVEGTVYIGFSIDENGRVTKPELLKDLGYGCGQEAIRILDNMPPWQPAIKNGEPVAIDMSLPIRFSLQGAFSNNPSIYWAGIVGNEVSRKQLLKSKSEPIIVRDKEGNSLEIQELWMAYRRSFWKKVTDSRGKITPKMRRILWWSRPGGELTLVATVQQNGKFFEVNRVLTVSE